MCVDIDGERYEGCGPTKQRAKCNAAKAALKKAFQIFVILGFQISETKTLSWRCTSIGRAKNTRCSTRPAKIIKKYLQCAWILAVRGAWADKTEGQVQRRQGCTEEGVPNICDFGVPDIGNKNPIMALHEHRPSSKYSLLYDTGKDHKKISTMCVDIDGERY